MDSTKSWWQSKSIWLGILTGIAAALSPIVPSLASYLSAHMAVIGVIWSVVAIVLRVVSKDKISLGD